MIYAIYLDGYVVLRLLKLMTLGINGNSRFFHAQIICVLEREGSDLQILQLPGDTSTIHRALDHT